MLNYQQSSGQLWLDNTLIGTGYSGYQSGKNNPADEAVPFLGPIPCGRYRIGTKYDSSRVGPICLPLTPLGHTAHGRTDFLIHGDSRKHPGEASRGCIILPRYVRQWIIDEKHSNLLVTP